LTPAEQRAILAVRMLPRALFGGRRDFEYEKGALFHARRSVEDL
jgi:hypothetical protein